MNINWNVTLYILGLKHWHTIIVVIEDHESFYNIGHCLLVMSDVFNEVKKYFAKSSKKYCEDWIWKQN